MLKPKAGSTSSRRVAPGWGGFHKAELINYSIKALIEHGVDHALSTQVTQCVEKAWLTKVDLIMLSIMLGVITPTGLQSSKLLAITVHTSALAANVTSNIYDRFNRHSSKVLHGQCSLGRKRGPFLDALWA
jgi:hypothetical protein